MKTILLAVLLLFGAAGAFAQEKTLSKAEFDSVIKNAKWALTEWKGKSLRMTQTHETKTEGKNRESSSGKITMEFISPTVSRLTSEITSRDKTTKNESIRIENKTYKRTDDGAWTEGTSQGKEPMKSADSMPVENQGEKLTEYKFLGTEQVNGQTANVYVETTKIKRLNQNTNQEMLSTFMRKYWFGEDGVKLKEESTGKTQGAETSIYSRMMTVWEIDPTIKVEAPKIN